MQLIPTHHPAPPLILYFKLLLLSFRQPTPSPHHLTSCLMPRPPPPLLPKLGTNNPNFSKTMSSDLWLICRGLPNSITNHVLQHLVLAINGTDVCTIQDIQDTLDGCIWSTHGRLHLTDNVLAGFVAGPIIGLQFLVVKKPHRQIGRTLHLLLVLVTIACYVQAFCVCTHLESHSPMPPPTFLAEMKGPYRGEWLAALFTHLANCHQIGTYGPPLLPPRECHGSTHGTCFEARFQFQQTSG